MGMVPDPRGNIPLYSFDLAGLILSPTKNHHNCAHPGDVGSLQRKCNPWGLQDWCVPGCSPNSNSLGWCVRSVEHWLDDWPCAYPPSSLKDVMRHRNKLARDGIWYNHKMWDDGKFYDEQVFDAATFTKSLPGSIDAFFFIRGGMCKDAYDGPKCESYARSAHRAFL